MYSVRISYPFLWPADASFDRRRWPRAQAATVVEEEDSPPCEPRSRCDQQTVLEMHWVITADVNGGLCLRVAWTPLRQDELAN
jgi:hypothetical protein